MLDLLVGEIDSRCNDWTVTAYPEDLACAGITFQSDNEAYPLPFVLAAWVIE